MIMFIFFVPLVFMGAFFMLNLTLAVINSKFTEAHHAQEEADAEEAKNATKRAHIENELESATNSKDEMSIN